MLRSKQLLCATLLIFCIDVQGMEEDAYHSGRAYLAEVERLETIIESITASEGPFNEALFDPLMALARLRLKNGLSEDAIDTLRRAQNIAHRNEGVYTPRQLEIIETLAELSIADGDYEDANQQQKFSFFITQHHTDQDDPALLVAYREMADWYMHTGQTLRARRLLEEALELATSMGEQTLPLALEINRARRLHGLCCNPKRLVSAVDQSVNNPDTDRDVLQESYLEIADTLTLGNKSREASEYYKLAYELSPQNDRTAPKPIMVRRVLEDPRQTQSETYRLRLDPLFRQRRLERQLREEELEDLTQKPQWFILDPDDRHHDFSIRDRNETSSHEERTQSLRGSPLLFSEDQLNNLLPYRLKRNDEELRIEMSFTVTETGDLQNIEIVSSNAPIKLERLVKNALRKLNFRPAIVDGVTVATDNVKFIQTFSRTSG
jgi:tetratricopeptide (TPR) repeat protein